MTQTYPVPAEVETKALTLCEQAKAIAVTSEDDYRNGADFRSMLAEAKRQVQSAFRPIIDAAHKAHKEALAQEKKFTGPLDEADGVVKSAMSRYRTEQERIRLAELARQEAERRAEQQRRDLYYQAQVSAERKAKEEERVKLLEDAEFLGVDAGHIAAQPIIVSVPLPEMAPQVPAVIAEKPRTAGVAEVKVYKYEVTDARALALAALTEGSGVPFSLIQLDQRLIRLEVEEIGELCKWPGLRIWWEMEVRRR